MSEKLNIAIIGGGVIGLSLARALAGRGAEIAVFDASAVMPPATNAAAGMLAPSFENSEGAGELSKSLYQFGARALSMWPKYAAALEEETGVTIDFRAHGTLGVAFTEEEEKTLHDQAAFVASLGGEASFVSGDKARKLEPALSRDVVAALWAPKDAQVDPRRLLTALRAAMNKNFVRQFNEKVTRVDAGRDGVSITIRNGERYSARKAVLAGGAVSGLASGKFVFPVKGDATAIEIDEDALKCVVRAPGAYLCPKAGGRLVIGASEEFGRKDHTVEPKVIERLKANAARAVPILAGARELERWSGLRPGTPDGAPILGQADNGLYLALGHYRNGVLHATASAEDMATFILKGAITADLERFNPSRFSAPVV